MTMRVNAERLRADLEQLGTFGRGHDGSIDRSAFSTEDVAARGWFAARAGEAGLATHTDSLLNVILGDDSPTPAVWAGSHLDTVPDGGMFDGALGAVATLECMRCLHEEGVELVRPVRGVAFSDEEGSYLGFLGSKGLAHGLGHLDSIDPASVAGYRGRDGTALVDALRDAGGDLDAAHDRGLRRDAVHQFVELHIEQGPTLEAAGTQIGVVTHIVGVGRVQVRFEGRADHAGTTPMHMRRDALRGAAAFMDGVPELPASAGLPDAVITCGQVMVAPGAANVVPSSAVVHLDYREESPEGLRVLEEAIVRTAHACGARNGLRVSYTLDSITPPVGMDRGVSDAIKRSAKDLGLSMREMPSGAGHDAQVMAEIAPTGMIFVPSHDGRSHSRLEHTSWEDVANGADVLLNTLLVLAGARGADA